LTPPVLRRLRELVQAGVTVVGPRPGHSPSLANFPECDAQVGKLADELWGACDGSRVLEHNAGRGRIVWGKSLAGVFATMNLKPDFDFPAEGRSKLAYAHRRAGLADIYFVSNQRRQFDSADCTFRVAGKVPELWHPDTGVVEAAPVWSSRDGRTTVRLSFDPAGSVFVIFRHSATRTDHLVDAQGSLATQTTETGKLEIQHAVYAAIDSGAGMDVTARIAELARNGEREVVANNSVLGGDPAGLRVKELRVDYTLDGRPAHATARENDTLSLPGVPSANAAPSYEMSAAAGGRVKLTTWNNGRVELSTANGKRLALETAGLPEPEEVTGPWNVTFPPNWGAPAAVTLDRLISWTDHPDNGVRYFSGTATYEKELRVSPAQLAGGRELWLDLGAVKNFAEVSLNGQDLGTLWKPPFRVNLAAAAKPGPNRLVIKVTNLWPNRLIGDEQLPPDREWNGDRLSAWPQWLLEGKPSPTGRFTFTTWHHWKEDSRLLESGLLGPVLLRTASVQPVK
jgi:hypothetical protein